LKVGVYFNGHITVRNENYTCYNGTGYEVIYSEGRDRVFEEANTLFADTIWPRHIVPVINSFLYTIIPRDSGINVSELVIALQNGDPTTKIKGIFGPILDYITNDFKKEVNNTIRKTGAR